MNKKKLLALVAGFFFLTGKAQQLTNPILAGFYPDPSIAKAGNDYYIINSSFAYYPGLPIFHSKDLLNWKQIGYAMDRPDQLDLEGAGVSRGLFAPAITYHNGIFYIVCTEVSKLGNFVITAKDPAGPWSDPVSLPQVNGIDPSIFFDDNGKAYIVFNSIPPDNKPEYDGHRTIRMFEFDPVNLKVTGDEILLVNGGTDISKKPVWIEGPHIFKKDGWYYLICAEGGTAYNHSEVVFRSKSVAGPYIPYEKNPILTQRHLDPQRKNPVTTTGHADFVEDAEGNWWAIFLGCRPYEGDFYNTGRETFMTPIVWRNGWPEFELGGDEVKYAYPINAKIDQSAERYNGNYHFKDDFSSKELNIRYRFLRTVRQPWYNLTDKPGVLTLQLRPETVAGTSNPSFVGFHQPHLKGYAATSINFDAAAENEKAGLLLFQNEKTYYYICKSVKNNQPVIELYKGAELLKTADIKINKGQEVFFKIEAKGDQYAMYYALQKDKWILFQDNIDARELSTKSAGGFVGCLYAMYATSEGKPSVNKAFYNWFEVKNNDDIYSASAQEYKSYPMWNPALSVEERVNDVVSRLTLEEKVAQMLNATPAIPRLGIPAYDWWNEVLHGVARTPFKVTSYPQAIGMAATWDTTSLKMMADYSAIEGRAIYNKAIEMGKTSERYWGLTYWTPNINIFRDPRWGRGQETYGEDPFLTAKLGAAFVRGLQGNDGKYLKAAACAKHFAVHSGPEPSRHSDNFNPTVYDLWDTYLPAFKELITKADVAGVMCAYNAVNTQPCCANDLLMNDILRDQWNFTGYVTSDCWAIDDFFKYHKTHPDATSSAIDAVVHGTDLECGQTVYKSLYEGVKNGLIKEELLDVSLKRLFTVRYRLGMFDPVDMVGYAQTPASVLESAPHQAHALKMAQQSIVLLKNQNNTLPLNRNIKKIAVVGPNADNAIAVLGNYNGTPSRVVTLLDGIREKLGASVEVVYEKGINFTNDTLLVYDDISMHYSIDGVSGVKAEYFNNQTLEGEPAITQIVKDIDYRWAEGQSPATGVNPSHYSGRYTTYLTAPKDEILNFEIEGDDGYRVIINDSVYAEAWLRNRWGPKQFRIPVTSGARYKVVVEFYQTVGNAVIRLSACHNVKTDFAALANRLKDADAIIFAGGISPQLEGEEMPVNAPGFNGGDRTSILLPAVQTALMQALHKTGKPVVFVMMTGSAIATPWESKNIPAIVNAWYAGQSAGTAIADVLFGDYNPAGRLPVTFYKSDKDLPDFMSYDMKNRTYRYFKGEALYPFGYGLSYTSFAYNDLKVPGKLEKGTPLKVSVAVRNSGNDDGEEVVQLYLTHKGIRHTAPIRSLKGFQRIALKKGESKTIEFLLTPEELMLVNENGSSYQPAGKIEISVGGGQPGVKNKTTSNVLTKVITVL